jgi:hypothetical protein
LFVYTPPTEEVYSFILLFYFSIKSYNSNLSVGFISALMTYWSVTGR